MYLSLVLNFARHNIYPSEPVSEKQTTFSNPARHIPVTRLPGVNMDENQAGLERIDQRRAILVSRGNGRCRRPGRLDRRPRQNRAAKLIDVLKRREESPLVLTVVRSSNMVSAWFL